MIAILKQKLCQQYSKIEPKWSPNRYKICLKIDLIFVTIPKRVFLDFGSILAPKTCLKWRLSNHFFNLVANMREVWFYTTLHRFFNVFRLWKPRCLTLKGMFFIVFVESSLKTYFFRNWSPKGSKIQATIEQRKLTF